MAMERQHRPIDKEFEECYFTGVLDISGRNLRMFPNIGDDIYDPLEVFTGVISSNRFDKFPRVVLTYVNIVTLNFHNNALRSIPSDLTRLQELRHLDLSRNFLQKLPSSLCELQLETLSVNNNRLQVLPPELGKMTSLKSLDVSCNDLTDLPKSFTDLQSLTYLNMRRNEIRELPTDIFKIPLWYLNINSNCLSRLPVALRHLTSLTEFHCSNNPLEIPPAKVCVRGLTHVFKYLSEMEKYGSDPQLFASNREESLMRRRRDRGKRNVRPTSDASTISGDGSDYERSFLDEMSTFVQSAFGGKDGHFLGRNESEPAGGSNKYWKTQLKAYEENSPYRSSSNKGSGVRYRSQSPGPSPVQSQNTPTHSTSGTHFGTLPRSNKGSNSSLQSGQGGRGLGEETGRSGSFHNYGGSNRMSSPVYSGSDSSRVLRTLSSDNHPSRTPSNPDLNSNGDERSFLSKKTELLPNSSASHQYHASSTHQTTPTSSSSKATPIDIEATLTDTDRPPSPAMSRDGSVTPTPEDLDTGEPLTPKKTPEDFTVSNIIRLLENHDFNFSAKWEELSQQLGVSLDTRQKASVKAHMTEDTQSALGEVLNTWLTDNDCNPLWSGLLTALEGCGQTSIVSSLKKSYLLLDKGIPTDVNLTPQHKKTSIDKQVSFSVAVSEIPSGDNSSSLSPDPAHPIAMTTATNEESDIDYSRTSSCPEMTVATTTTGSEEPEEEIEDSESPSPSLSPSQSPRKGPQTAPKPSKKKDSIDNTTWPKKRSGGPHKRKGDVFKSIGKQDPNFTVRRMEVHMMEELEKIQAVKKEIEDILSVSLSDDLGDNISDGILLCELVNCLHPNTIPVIHRPKREEHITGPKRTMNIAAFIAACKKVRVPEALVCSAGDISEYKDPIRVCACLRGLLDTVSV